MVKFSQILEFVVFLREMAATSVSGTNSVRRGIVAVHLMTKLPKGLQDLIQVKHDVDGGALPSREVGQDQVAAGAPGEAGHIGQRQALQKVLLPPGPGQRW